MDEGDPSLASLTQDDTCIVTLSANEGSPHLNAYPIKTNPQLNPATLGFFH